jgi:hypothetical protein
MELVELVPHWIDKLKKLRVPVNGVTQMIVGPGARAASKDPKAVRALLIQGLEFEAVPAHAGAARKGRRPRARGRGVRRDPHAAARRDRADVRRGDAELSPSGSAQQS